MNEQEKIRLMPEPTASKQPSEARRSDRPRRGRIIIPIVLLLVLAGGGYLIWRNYFAEPAVQENVIALSGRIEGDDAVVAPKTGGRILEVRVREGDTVKTGDTIATLDDQQINAREEQASAALNAAEARAKVARDQIAVFEEQFRQNQLQTEQSKIDVQGRVGQAEAELAAAEADLVRQQAAHQLATFDEEAYTRLAKTGAVSERQGKQAISAAAQQAAAVAASKRRVEAARSALTMAQANLANPAIRGAGAETVRKQITQQQAEIKSAAASIEQARAQLREAQANRQDLIVTAPFDGTVTTRAAEPGEVVMAGTAIVTLLDLTKVYLRGFIPEGQIGHVKAGQPARVYLDSNPNQPIEAAVSRIDPEAMFTPENTYFRDDRVKQVVGVKLHLKSGFGYAKPGMPADGEILTRGETWPQSRRRR